ncbi:MAG: hypothetical protein RIT25_1508 [Planctomycetota bacterium]
MARPLASFLGALACGSAVGLGAFGAHGLKGVLEPAQLDTWNTAVLYQLVHGLAMLVTALAPMPQRLGSAVLHCFGWGILCFSGSLYLLATAGMKFLGPVTPLGGVLFLVGWILFAAGALRAGRKS